MHKTAAVAALLFFTIFLSAGMAQYTQTEERIVPGDAIRVQVWQMWDTSSPKNIVSNLSGDYVVDPGGDIFLPYVGVLNIAGKTPEQIAEMIKEKYAGFLKKPFIYVRPLMRVTVRGAVARPGLYRVDPKSSLWDLLDEAGGPTNNADLRKISVVRGDKKVVENLLQAFEKAYSLKEVGVKSGD
ncbi:MAG TPA: polysaccharide export protein, partial [Bacteroidetes bacterium]|nr:polysaccharide export protein [Bacteroidota bacterium]